MADATQTTRFRFWLWLIAIVGVIVPRRLRADWRQEWEAELRNREALLAEWDRLDWRSKLGLLRRSTSAFWDGLLLQPKRLEEEVFQDVYFGLRMLRKNPGFTLVAVLTLGLGIGANTAIFSVVNAVLIRPLPYHDAGRLAMLWTDDPRHNLHEEGTSYLNFQEWKQQSHSFEELALCSRNHTATVTVAAQPERIEVGRVSANLFPLLGVAPVLGRV